MPLHYCIIGTEHRLQVPSRAKLCQSQPLRYLIQQIIDKNNVVLIAEEVDANKDVHSFGRGLIGDDKCLSIDMTKCEQREAGIADDLANAYRIACAGRNVYPKRADTIRENFWLDRIRRFLEKRQLQDGTIVITCGRNHLEFLAEKIDSIGICYTTAECPIGLRNKLPPLEILP